MNAKPSTAPRHTDDVRQRLLQAALGILYEEGFQALTQTHVAQRAGVRQGHLTYYFPTRSHLLTAMAEFGTQEALGQFWPDASTTLPPTWDDYLQAIAETILDMRMSRLMTGLKLVAEEEPAVKAWIEGFRVWALACIQDALQHYGIPATPQQAQLFHTLIVGLSVLSLPDTQTGSIEWVHTLIQAAAQQLLTPQHHPGEIPA